MTTRSSVNVIVHGIPAPQGSKNAYIRGGHAVLVEASKKLPAWRDKVIEAAKAANIDGTPFITPVHMDVVFILPKPVKPKFPEPGVKPDLDKLIRSVGDALTIAGLLKDDSLIVSVFAEKLYETRNRPPGAFITITTR